MAEGVAAKPGEDNHVTTDQYTFRHMAFGALTGYYGMSAALSLTGAVVWEVVEPTLKRQLPGVFPKNTIDSFQNKAGDTAYWMVGWLLGYALRSEDE